MDANMASASDCCAGSALASLTRTVVPVAFFFAGGAAKGSSWAGFTNPLQVSQGHPDVLPATWCHKARCFAVASFKAALLTSAPPAILCPTCFSMASLFLSVHASLSSPRRSPSWCCRRAQLSSPPRDLLPQICTDRIGLRSTHDFYSGQGAIVQSLPLPLRRFGKSPATQTGFRETPVTTPIHVGSLRAHLSPAEWWGGGRSSPLAEPKMLRIVSHDGGSGERIDMRTPSSRIATLGGSGRPPAVASTPAPPVAAVSDAT